MKKMFMLTVALVVLLAFIVVFPTLAMAQAEGGAMDSAFSWEYLATISGATAATLLVVQFLKVPLDRVWKIPTRVFVYVVSFVLLAAGVGFTTGLNAGALPLIIVNAFVVALAAMGSYELTFAKATQEKPPDE